MGNFVVDGKGEQHSDSEGRCLSRLSLHASNASLI